MPASARAQVSLRPMLPSDAPLLAALFEASIDELTSDDYDPGQRAAWAGEAENVEAFGSRLASWLTIVASVGGDPAGFASLKGSDIFEMLYVHPGYAGQGVAAVLSDAIEKLAQARGAKNLTVQASDTAQGFFAKRGYRSERRGTVALGDEWLGQTSMVKALTPAADQPQDA